jgi:polar amino acid transport system ATP-binding protein
MPEPSVPAISVLGLSKVFGELEVLRNVTFAVTAGTTVCVLGPSGSGKSTLLRCINYLEEPTTGAVFLHGDPVGYLNSDDGRRIRMTERQLASMRSRMGMVFQHFNLWPHLTVLGNVTEAPLRVQKRPRPEVEAEARALLARMGLAEKVDVFPHVLSGGQKQRVAIARALAIKPEVLLFDEPTSALDPEIVGDILAVMRDLSAEGLTMVVVTHEMGFAREAADLIVFLDEGRVIEAAAPGDFFANPKTERAKRFLARYDADTSRRVMA